MALFNQNLHIFLHNLSQQQNSCLRKYTTRIRPGRNNTKNRRVIDSRFVKSKVPALDEIVLPKKVPFEKHASIGLEGVHSQLSRQIISSVLDRFSRESHIKELAATQNITKNIFQKAFQSFRLNCCSEPNLLDPGLQVIFSDIIKYDQSVDLIYPYFLRHAHKVFPHLERIKELRIISDLTQPHNWYPLAREIQRKIIFHAGPTNSGKTYEALEAFKKAKSGMYCGPLRLLAFEIYERINKDGIPCDMVTGEQRLFAHDSECPAAHCTFTAEMLPVDDKRDICVIDEIQMLRDVERGSAWSRALLGVATDEVHLCGEEAAIDLVQRLLDPIGEHVDIRKYKRKGELVVIDTYGLRDLSSIQDGDCIIHFNKHSIISDARRLKHEYGKEAAIIFGDLPPETKKEQIAKFNDPEHPCKILLATDAIGMGINLNIKRVIFSSLMDNRSGKIFPSYFVSQIAGRAGRFASLYCKGEVMTFKDEDSRLLGRLMREPIQQIAQAGISPSFDTIELFSIHLPHCSLSQLLDIFASISSVSDDFFACSYNRIKELAMLIEHIPLSLKDRYSFCLCPIKVTNGSFPFLHTSYLLIVRRYSEGNAITFDFIKGLVKNEMKIADNLDGLHTLGEVYDLLYSYLWLSYRFEEYFPHRDLVRELQSECGDLINESIHVMISKGYTKKSIKKLTELDKQLIKKLINEEKIEKKEIKIKKEEEIQVKKEEKNNNKKKIDDKPGSKDFEKSFHLVVTRLKK